MSKRAVLMMTFGSPEEITYEGVAEFFTNIRRGVRPEPHKIQTLHDNYLRIGGTPLQRITREEVDLVASALGEQCRFTWPIIFTTFHYRCDYTDGE
ncbi:Ferrochelatase [Streptococcus thermophilus CNCM I-1630]|nr:Ferrochelatase [Streptococcus thermophilus CNCM I-1630]